MSYYYIIHFTFNGLQWVKFGSGTNGRRSEVERGILGAGGQITASDQTLVGHFNQLALEGHVKKQHALTRYWGFRGLFDGSTEVWPASEMPALLRTAARILAAMKTGAQFAEPTASEAVIELFYSLVLDMPNHEQLNLLDACSGDGALSNNLVGRVARVVQVTIDPPATLPGDVPNFDVQVVPGDVLAIPDGRRADVVVMNPPFSDRKETGSKTSNNSFWKFIRKAQALAPVVIFIAPQTWESALTTRDRTGTYEVIEYAADFGTHPTASVIRWTAGPEFRVIGGRDDRRPEMPKFNVGVLPTRRQGIPVPAEHAAVGQTFKPLQPGDTVAPMGTLLAGPDAEACVHWIIANREALTHWWGCAADGMERLQTSQIKELLT